MKNWTVKVTNFKACEGRTYTYMTIEEAETKITTKQFDKLITIGSVNTRHGILTLEKA